jgi:2-polyprenyl-3-methyl-5-hydroxy-6-metoxy-1,4-benzoquinol methylase
VGGCGVFKQRAHGSEFLDRPNPDPRLVQQSYRFMKLVNRIGGGIRVVRRFLARELAQHPKAQAVRVLDIGAGDCDIPLAVTRWAGRRGYPVQFTCLDHDPKAIELAQETLARARCDNIKLARADILTYRPAGAFDYAVGSMTFHHFTDEQIDQLLTHLRGFVRRAVLINDLHRCLLNYVVCYILVRPLDREIRHDALLSIRRGFKPAELRAMLRKHDPATTVTRSWFCRVAGVVHFERKEGK